VRRLDTTLPAAPAFSVLALERGPASHDNLVNVIGSSALDQRRAFVALGEAGLGPRRHGKFQVHVLTTYPSLDATAKLVRATLRARGYQVV
jgi:hypothetical protein